MKKTEKTIEQFKEWPVFSLRDVRLKIQSKKKSDYAKVLIHQLVRKGKIKALGKGKYTIHDDIIAAGFAFSPFYYGLHFALTQHGLWSQATNPVVITTKKVRTGLREIMGGNVIVRRIQPSFFFGYETVQQYGYWIPVSTPEKTLIDFVYFREKIPSEAKEKLLKKIDPGVIRGYLKRTSPWIKKRVQKIMKELPPNGN